MLGSVHSEKDATIMSEVIGLLPGCDCAHVFGSVHSEKKKYSNE